MYDSGRLRGSDFIQLIINFNVLLFDTKNFFSCVDINVDPQEKDQAFNQQ